MIFRNKTTGKPPLGSQLDASHPLAQGLVGCWLFNEGGGKSAINLCDAVKLSSTTGYMDGVGAVVPDYLVNSGFVGNKPIKMATDVGTAFFKVIPFHSSDKLPGTTGAYLFDSDNYRHAMYRANAANTMGFYFNGYSKTTTSAVYAANIAMTVACVWNKTGNIIIPYINAVELAATPTGSWGSVAIGTNVYVGRRIANNESWNGKFICTLIYNRVLSAQEIQSLHEMTRNW